VPPACGERGRPSRPRTDGENVVVNTVQGYQKARNVERDPRVAVSVSDPANPSRYHTVRGRVTAATPERMHVMG
jgi:arabinogalactan endo-1,4-beta-galactosidase